MRVAGGVLLIISAFINIFAAIGYFGAGAATSAVGSLGQMATEEAAKNGTTMTPEAKKALESAASVKSSGGGLMFFGIYLLITVGTSIAGAVMLFQRKNATFILIAGVMAALAEVGGAVIIKFGVLNVVGLAGAILAIIASRSLKSGHMPGSTQPVP